jgi:hypothetical protein
MAIKITPTEEEKKFKPFSITLDIENETQASLVFAALLMEGHEITIMNRKASLAIDQPSFNPTIIRDYRLHINGMMEPDNKKLSKQ